MLKRRTLGSVLLFLFPLLVGATEPAALRTVGVLGNTSGLSDRPMPYAFYTGIGCDTRGRLYLSGAAEGIAVCSQDGPCLAVLPLPAAAGLTTGSRTARAGDALFFVAHDAGRTRSALFCVDTSSEDPTALAATLVAAGPGAWALSPTVDAQGRAVVGKSDVTARTYTVTAFSPGGGDVAGETLFTLALPAGATRPWRHLVQVDEDGAISIDHAGGVNWSGHYSPAGKRLGDARGGQLVDGLRYHFGYEGGLRRMDLADAAPAPGECGSGAPEIRMAAQVVRIGERYFFAGRGGVLEAAWNGTTFDYTRRIGAVHLEDLATDGDVLLGIAFTAHDNFDVQHGIRIPKRQPIGELLRASEPYHGRRAAALVPAPYGTVVLSRNAKGERIVRYEGTARHLAFEQALDDVTAIGQAAVLNGDLLLADPAAGVIWRRPLMDRTAPVTAWRRDLPGVTGLAVGPEGVFAATATNVLRLVPATGHTAWTSPAAYRGVRRLAATAQHVYVCDTAAHVVDQLDVETGELRARLGVPGEPGADLRHLNRPWAVAADVNGVYVADNGNGRIVVATTTLWKPAIPVLPREDRRPIVAATLPVPKDLPGRISVNVYGLDDVTVRQLACAQPAEAPVTWDGLDQYGRPAAPGRYRFHGLVVPELALRYVTSIGQSGNPPYRTADGKGSWGGVWGYVMDICPVTPDPDSDIVVLWAFEEGEGGLIRMSQDGEVRWKQHLDWWMKANQNCVASDGEYVYIGCASAMNAPEGQSNYGGSQRRSLLWRVDAATGAKRLYAPAQPDQPMYGDYHEGLRAATDITLAGGRLLLTSPADDAIFVIDPTTAALLATWPLPAASGVAAVEGTVYAGSGRTVVALDANGAVARTVAESGGEVWDVEPAPGGGLVVTVGAPRHQVVYLDAQGREMRAVGTRGGRPTCGRMQPLAFRDPAGLCVTGNGRLFVAERAAPKRFTRWSAAGALEREFHGPYYYSGMFGIDEAEPEYVYGDTHSDLIRYRVNYETGAWSVDHYWIGAYEDSGVPVKWWPRIRRHDGKVWWCSGSGGIVELLDDRVRGVAAVYGGWVEKREDGNFTPRSHQQKTGLKGTWSDLNGDGVQQPDEWQVTDTPAYPIEASGPQQGWGAYFDERFDLYLHDWSDTAVGGIWRVPVSEWRGGAPVYRWESAEQVGLPRLGVGLAHGAAGARTAFAHAGAVYAFNGGYNAAGLPGVGHGQDWEFAQVTKYDAATGRPVWHAGARTPGFAAPGQHYCPTGPSGVIGDYLFWTDENSLVHAWDVRHGLYVGTLLEDISRGPKPSPYTVWVELFNTRVFRHPRTGKVYLMAASDAIHVFEVRGTEAVPRRFEGEFELTAQGLAEADARRAAQRVRDERTLTIGRAAAPPRIDGDAGEFAETEVADLVLTETARGSVRLLTDASNLYVAFEVIDDSPWKNAGGDATALFKSGDTVSVWLGPAGGKSSPAIGDVRVLFAPGKGGVQAVVYRPKVAEGATPVTFRSPSGQVQLDRVAPLERVVAAVALREGGYTLEAAIPWSELGDRPEGRCRLDLSINFSDPAGERNVARLHWGRNGAAIVYDLPSEARFEPALWGVGLLAQ